MLLSESQERMLMVVKKGEEEKVKTVFEKWDLPCSEIGEVTDRWHIAILYEWSIGSRITCTGIGAWVAVLLNMKENSTNQNI